MLEFHTGIPNERLELFIILPSGAPRKLKQMAFEFWNSMAEFQTRIAGNHIWRAA